MPGPAPLTAVAPRKLYYALVDGSPAIDSAVFGAQLEKHRGWRNLLKDFLSVAMDDPLRLHDPQHPYLPICVYDQDGTQVAIVCPGGREAKGQDPFWQTYPGRNPKTGAPDPTGQRSWPWRKDTRGRHTAAEESALYMNQFILQPQVELIFGGAGGTQMIGQLPDGSPTPGGSVFAADLLYVSSHGWLGGFAAGFTISSWLGANPQEAQGTFTASRYFSVGKYADAGHGFAGPQWIVLAQCSTVNSATWPLWARVLAKSNPRVRGILAYEEASPLPQVAAGIARRFFTNLDANQTFLDAWKNANGGNNWAAIVHKDAIHDRLDGWRAFAPLADVSTSATVSNYLGFLTSLPNGERILDVPPPFELILEILTTETNGWLRVTSANLGWTTEYCSNVACRLTIRAPRGEVIKKAKIRWVHIRPTHGYKPSIDDLFVFARFPAGNTSIPITKGSKDLDVDVPGSPSEVQIDLLAPPKIANKHLEAHHSYLWPRVELQTSTRTLTYDFRTIGLLYFER
ncbi:hypothetical protein LVJ94_14430 [Pendulispora rubella]|uniref:Uncharacterized protein n=1 Tax=Pendulispora rubella TaxID=2741070 RepID=A0ABZ2LFU5_9BACT